MVIKPGTNPCSFAVNRNMSTKSRDTFALFVVASLAVLTVLYDDADLGGLFQAILSRL